MPNAWQDYQSLTFCKYRLAALRRLGDDPEWQWSDEVASSVVADRLDGRAGVYALYSRGVCQYVGATGNLASRLIGSIAERCGPFASEPWVWSVVVCQDRDEAMRVEAWAIGSLSPVMNLQRPVFSASDEVRGWSSFRACNLQGEGEPARLLGLVPVSRRRRYDAAARALFAVAASGRRGVVCPSAERRAAASVRLVEMHELARKRRKRSGWVRPDRGWRCELFAVKSFFAEVAGRIRDNPEFVSLAGVGGKELTRAAMDATRSAMEDQEKSVQRAKWALAAERRESAALLLADRAVVVNHVFAGRRVMSLDEGLAKLERWRRDDAAFEAGAVLTVCWLAVVLQLLQLRGRF